MRELFLTFDVEDFIGRKSIQALRRLLELLDEAELKGLFFITGHAAEELSCYRDVLDLLRNHEVGLHSSSHSVRPTVFEYTDVKSYDEAVQAVLLRETSHVHPLTGDVGGSGGITLLKQLFPNKSIVSFRAPGLCWLPTVSEALFKLGVTFDFSTDLSHDPVSYKGITFYPYPFPIGPPEGHDFKVLYGYLMYSFLRRRVIVLVMHPHSIVRNTFWDSIYFSGNPDKLVSTTERSRLESMHLLRKFSNLFKHIAALKRLGVFEVTPPLCQSSQSAKLSRQLILNEYLKSIWWAKHFFNYQPHFLYSHYLKFFNLERDSIYHSKLNDKAKLPTYDSPHG